MKLKFLLAFTLAFFFASLNAPAQSVASVDPVDFSTFSTGVDCYANGEFMIHAYENRLDCYSQDGILRSYKVKSCTFREDSVTTTITKIYNTTSNTRFQVDINDGQFRLKTPFDSQPKDAYQVEFIGIYKWKMTAESKTAYYWPYLEYSRNYLVTPWGRQEIPPQSQN